MLLHRVTIELRGDHLFGKLSIRSTTVATLYAIRKRRKLNVKKSPKPQEIIIHTHPLYFAWDICIFLPLSVRDHLFIDLTEENNIS